MLIEEALIIASNQFVYNNTRMKLLQLIPDNLGCQKLISGRLLFHAILGWRSNINVENRKKNQFQRLRV